MKPRSPLFELTFARLLEFAREPGIVFWVFLFPLLMAFGLGIAFRNQTVEAPRVAVVGAPEAQETRALKESRRLKVVALPEDAARRELLRTKVDLVVLVEPGAPRLLFDPRSGKSEVAKLLVTEVLEEAAGRKDLVRPKHEASVVPGARYIDYLIPGLIGMNLMGTSLWGVGYNLVLARKRRLLRRYAVTPMRRTHFLLSYFFARSLFLFAEIGVLLLFGWALFGTTIVGSLLAYAWVAFLGAASFAGISLMIGARIENTEVANGWMNLVQLPMWVLSGVFFSYERFPEWMWPLIRALPLTAINDALRTIGNEGGGLLSCRVELLVLLVWGGVGFLVAKRMFRWQ